jgi:hypothetical protein
MTFADQSRNDLTELLESSVAAVQTGGRFVSRLELPSESQLVATQAELARVCRAGRSGRFFEVLPFPEAL